MVKVLEFYSGIGGTYEAFKKLNIDYVVLESFDINENANIMHKINHPDANVVNCCIESIKIEKLNEMNIDVITMSPPCQPFTRIGKKQDVKDSRCNSFLHILSMISRLEKLPKYIFIENVKGFENSHAHEILIETLGHRGYSFQEFLLTPSQFGIPNSRLRYYLIAKNGGAFSFSSTKQPLDHIPTDLLPSLTSQFPEMFDESSPHSTNDQLTRARVRYKACRDISTFLQTPTAVAPYILPYAKLLKYQHLLDIVEPGSDHSCCFNKSYGRKLEGAGSLLLTITNEGLLKELQAKDVKDKLSHLLSLAVSDAGPEPSGDNKGENCLVYGKDFYVRFFTPTEIANLMSFPPRTFRYPSNLTDKQRYSLIGNSVNVDVVSVLLYTMINT